MNEYNTRYPFKVFLSFEAFAFKNIFIMSEYTILLQKYRNKTYFIFLKVLHTRVRCVEFGNDNDSTMNWRAIVKVKIFTLYHYMNSS